MLKLFSRKPSADQVAEQLSLRLKLFAMQDLETLVKGLEVKERESPPGLFFVAAAYRLLLGQQAEAVAELQQATQPGFSTWWRLAAWHQLRELGIQPPETQVKIVRAMVLEYPLKDRRAILAAYAGCSASYLDVSGRLFSWEEPDPSTLKLIDEFLGSGQPILQRTQLWIKPEPGPPPSGSTRLSILTDAGLHFDQGPAQKLSKDPLSGKVVHQANALIASLNKDLRGPN